jgi:hypothetical protein
MLIVGHLHLVAHDYTVLLQMQLKVELQRGKGLSTAHISHHRETMADSSASNSAPVLSPVRNYFTMHQKSVTSDICEKSKQQKIAAVTYHRHSLIYVMAVSHDKDTENVIT